MNTKIDKKLWRVSWGRKCNMFVGSRSSYFGSASFLHNKTPLCSCTAAKHTFITVENSSHASETLQDTSICIHRAVFQVLIWRGWQRVTAQLNTVKLYPHRHTHSHRLSRSFTVHLTFKYVSPTEHAPVIGRRVHVADASGALMWVWEAERWLLVV